MPDKKLRSIFRVRRRSKLAIRNSGSGCALPVAGFRASSRSTSDSISIMGGPCGMPQLR
jgi:hypothetical protein